MLTKEELTLLQIVSKKKLVRRSELKKMLETIEGVSLSLVDNLIERGFLSNISPLGESSFIITAEGIKALKGEQ